MNALTSDKIDAFIVQQERRLRTDFYRTEFELRYLINLRTGMEPYHRQKNIRLWECARDKLFGATLSPATRNLWQGVRNIYILDPAGESLPLNQAIRLLDVYRRAQAHLQAVKTRSQTPDAPGRDAGAIVDGAERPREFVGAKPRPAIDVGGELKSSCARLEQIIMNVQAQIHEHRMRDKPGQITRGANAVRVQSSAESEGQIEREAETLLRLEGEIEARSR